MRQRAAVLSIVAQDRASGVIDTLTGRANAATSSFGRWSQAAIRLTTGLSALKLAIIGVVAILPALVAAQSVVNFVKFEQAARRARLQLEIMGLSAQNAANLTSQLAGVLDRMTATTLFANRQAMSNLGLAGNELGLQLVGLAQDITEKFGIPFLEILEALFLARTTGDTTKLEGLIGKYGELDDKIGGAEGNAQELINRLQEITDASILTRVESLAGAFQRITELTAPTRDQMAEFIAAFLDVFITSFGVELENQKVNWEITILAVLGAVFALAGRGLAIRLVGGIAAGFVALLAINLAERVEGALEDPVFTAVVLATAFILGRSLGGSLVGGVVAALALELMPGLRQQFDALGEEDQALLIVTVGAIGIALAFRFKFIEALAIGLALREVAKGLITDDAVLTRWAIVGAVLGAVTGTPWGVLIGATIGAAMAELLDWFSGFVVRAFQFAGKAVATGFANAFIFVFNTMLRDLELQINRALTSIEEWIARVVSALNAIPGVNLRAPTLGSISLGGGLTPISAPKFIPPIPIGGLGSPVLTPPIGPPVPGGFGSGPIVIQLILDREILDEVILDTQQREFRRKDLR